MGPKLVVGNWKMNASLALNEILLSSILEGIASLDPRKIDVAVCVPYPYLFQCKDMLFNSSLRWGAQDVSGQEQGAFTGEVGASMLREFGSEFVIIGHSERRLYHGESDTLIASKALQVLKAGMYPIVCVGETLSEREVGRTNVVVLSQVEAVLGVVDDNQFSRVIWAYEPRWAIGTGRSANPESAQEVHAFLRARLVERNAQAGKSVQLLYGGSMKANNAADLLKMPDINGGLIGGASLKAAEFLDILCTASVA